ncbi:hypothetical protein [Bdellovibrio sp. HCB209]|uniref:hypothetical protein n=1 Tax=Bdellovibrio sp. HCB209 TaxID=3394354 RepID=UPI0039B66953
MWSSIVWILLTGIGYLFTPLFFDHAEVNIVAVASYWLQGHPIYTSLDSVSRYSLLYGPWPYLVNAVFLKMGEAIYFLGKLPGILNLLVLLIGFYFSLGNIPRLSRILGLGALSAVLLGYYNISYWNRPDSYLVTYTFLALALVILNNRIGDLATYLGVGLLAGLAANCKLHGVLYFLPVVVYFLEDSKKKINWLYFISAAILSLLGLVLPFALNNVGGAHYLQWLQMASKHGVDMLAFVKNITFIGCFILLLAVLGFQRKYKWTFISLIGAGIIVGLAASKPGSGSHHFMPFLPMILFFAIQTYWAMSSTDKTRLSYVWAAFLLTMSLNAFNRQKRVLELFKQTPMRYAELHDFEGILANVAGPLEMGLADIKSYESTFFKLSAIANSRGFLFDGTGLMDMHASAMDIPSTTLEHIKSCMTPYFVFPKGGEPWSIISYYDDKPLFSQSFIEVFNSTYHKERETEYYALYSCAKK